MCVRHIVTSSHRHIVVINVVGFSLCVVYDHLRRVDAYIDVSVGKRIQGVAQVVTSDHVVFNRGAYALIEGVG
jgi:hypothetical protein